MKRLSQRLGLGGRFSSSLKPVVDLTDDELEQRSKRIVRFQGVALSYLVGLKNDVQEERVALGVELFVAKVDLSAKVKQRMTIRNDGEADGGKYFGEVAYVEGQVYFRLNQVDFKPRSESTTEDVTESTFSPLRNRTSHSCWTRSGRDALDEVSRAHS